MTLSGVDLVVGAADLVDGAVDSAAGVDGAVDSVDGAAGTLTLQDIGIHTCQFIMVVFL
jgi:hypothetical protein